MRRRSYAKYKQSVLGIHPQIPVHVRSGRNVLVTQKNVGAFLQLAGELGDFAPTRCSDATRQAASVRGSLKTGSSLATKSTRYHSVTLRDPYLTQILFADFLEVQEKIGSSGRTRTYNPPVNSRMLCH